MRLCNNGSCAFTLACAQGDLKDKWRNWQRNVANGWSTARVYMPDDLKQRIEKMVHEYSNQTGGGEGECWGRRRAGKLVGKGGCGLFAGWMIGAPGELVRRQALQCARAGAAVTSGVCVLPASQSAFGSACGGDLDVILPFIAIYHFAVHHNV